jgi:hypothetical protein
MCSISPTVNDTLPVPLRAAASRARAISSTEGSSPTARRHRSANANAHAPDPHATSSTLSLRATPDIDTMYWRNLASALEDIGPDIRMNVPELRRNCSDARRRLSRCRTLSFIAVQLRVAKRPAMIVVGP